ncbi:hypothetical protein [Halomicrobium salinisoli]|uniref:hypothetical protein n=1 Tax=Halomicrobium salinisoli TaxID=2878391 RepID=UPI001CEFEFDF|nr:hypothetical protein [Halomicrobium salinisoli]
MQDTRRQRAELIVIGLFYFSTARDTIAEVVVISTRLSRVLSFDDVDPEAADSLRDLASSIFVARFNIDNNVGILSTELPSIDVFSDDSIQASDYVRAFQYALGTLDTLIPVSRDLGGL